MLKILLGVAIVLAVFLGYVSTREGRFRYERSGVIHAPADKIFPYLSQFKLGAQWSPYEKKDLNMKKTLQGEDGKPGAVMEFEGNREVGSGSLTLQRVVPNEKVEILLTMIKPFQAKNMVEYSLTPEGDGTRFTWAMSGDGGYMTKLVSVFIDCEKMVAGDFEAGIQNLKTVVESQK